MRNHYFWFLLRCWFNFYVRSPMSSYWSWQPIMERLWNFAVKAKDFLCSLFCGFKRKLCHQVSVDVWFLIMNFDHFALIFLNWSSGGFWSSIPQRIASLLVCFVHFLRKWKHWERKVIFSSLESPRESLSPGLYFFGRCLAWLVHLESLDTWTAFEGAVEAKIQFRKW